MMNVSLKSICVVLAAVAAASLPSVGRAGSLTTTYVSNNLQDGNMFDVETGGSALSVTSLGLNLQPGVYTINVYEKSGTWVGYESTPGAWTLVTTIANVNSVAADAPTTVAVSGLTLAASSVTGLYITMTGGQGMRYTDGTMVGDPAAINSDLTIYQGAGVHYPFDGIFTPRTWNGTITYDVITPAVPEPSSAVLAGLAGAVGLAAARLRKRRAA